MGSRGWPKVLTDPRALFLGSAGAGAVAWLAGVAALRPELAVVLLLLAPLVVVPLGLRLLAEGTVVWRVLGWVQWPAALALLGAFAAPQGGGAALWALPWFAVTGLVALVGLARLRDRGRRSAPELTLSFAMLYLAVGGGWLVLSRWGQRPLEFAPIIVLLTAVHFHYAGFALPLLAGLAGRALGGVSARLAAFGTVVGVPLVAAGITLTPILNTSLPELLAASFLVLASVPVVLLHVRLGVRAEHQTAGMLLVLSGLALAVSMPLAAAYALGSYLGTPWLDIPMMVRFHGLTNAVGFALLGIAGWNLTR